MKRPLPVQFGFTYESEVYRAEEEEEKRKARLARIRWGAFFVFFFIAAAPLCTCVTPEGVVPAFLRRGTDLMFLSVVLVLLGLAVSFGVVVGLLFSWGSHAIAERLFPSSEEYSRARAYHEALQWWRRKVKEDYGYPRIPLARPGRVRQ